MFHGSIVRGRLVAGVLMAVSLVAGGHARAEEALARSTDKEVRKQIEAIAERQEKFEKSLDGKFKKSIVRGPAGEVDVMAFLKDFESAVKRMDERFSGKYAASAEAADVFDRATRMHRYVREHPELKGANEWDAVAQKLAQLATSYGVTFPLEAGAKARRIGDGELADAAAAFAKAAPKTADALKKAARSVPALAGGAESGAKDLKAAASTAKTLASRISGGKPASAEARQLQVLSARIDALVATDGAPDALTSSWAACGAPLETILTAFGLSRGAASP
jgi:hypothetical protein